MTMTSIRRLALAVPLAAVPGLVSAEEFYDCVIEPFLVVQIGSAVEGVIESVDMHRGKLVKKGDIIARVESTVERESLRIAKAEAGSKVDIKIAEARVELAEKQAERARELVRRNAGTVVDRDISEAESEIARQELARAKERHIMNGLNRDRMEAIVERRVIRSPIDGVLLRRLIGPGEFVHSQAQVAQIAAVDPLYVDVFLPTSLYSRVSVGDIVTVRPQEPIGGIYGAEITAIDQVFDAASDTFGIRLELPNPGNKMPAGVDCTVSLTPSG